MVGAPRLFARWGVESRPGAGECAAELLADWCLSLGLMLSECLYCLVYSITTALALHRGMGS